MSTAHEEARDAVLRAIAQSVQILPPSATLQHIELLDTAARAVATLREGGGAGSFAATLVAKQKPSQAVLDRIAAEKDHLRAKLGDEPAGRLAQESLTRILDTLTKES